MRGERSARFTHQCEAGVELPHVHPAGPPRVELTVGGAQIVVPLRLLAEEGRRRLRRVRIQVDELRTKNMLHVAYNSRYSAQIGGCLEC